MYARGRTIRLEGEEQLGGWRRKEGKNGDWLTGLHMSGRN